MIVGKMQTPSLDDNEVKSQEEIHSEKEVPASSGGGSAPASSGDDVIDSDCSDSDASEGSCVSGQSTSSDMKSQECMESQKCESEEANGVCCFAAADVLMCPGLVRNMDDVEFYVPTDMPASIVEVPRSVDDCKLWLEGATRCERMATIAQWLFSVLEDRLGSGIASASIPSLMRKSEEKLMRLVSDKSSLTMEALRVTAVARSGRSTAVLTSSFEAAADVVASLRRSACGAPRSQGLKGPLFPESPSAAPSGCRGTALAHGGDGVAMAVSRVPRMPLQSMGTPGHPVHRAVLPKDVKGHRAVCP